MADWTTALVQHRLELAAGVFRQLPAVKPIGYFNSWPEYVHCFADKVEQDPQMRRPLPGPRQISEAEEAMLWLQWLEKDDARLVWLRANGKPWKPICWELGVSRTTAIKRWEYGVALITWRLNGRMPSAKRSRRFVVANANSLSRKIVL